LNDWQQNSGAGWATGDFTGDGKCDFADFQKLLDNWNPAGFAAANEEASNVASSPGAITDGVAASGGVAQTATVPVLASAVPAIGGPLSSGSLIQVGASLAAQGDVNSPPIQAADLLATGTTLDALVYVRTTKVTALPRRPSLTDASWTLDDGQVDLLTQLMKPVVA
jgi:hypothetical protein